MYKIDGFIFEDAALAAQARKEEEGIRYILEKTSLSDPQTILKLYKTLLQQKLFVTPVGLRFLMELQQMLLDSLEIPRAEIPPIDTSVFYEPILEEGAKRQAKKDTHIRRHNSKPADYKSAFHVALFFAIVFGCSVLGMFVITELSENNVNILNYREQIINEYEKWEQELEEKEDQLKEWEEQLKKQDTE